MSLKKKIAKTLSWRAHATTITLIITFILTRNLKIAGTLAITLMIIKTFLYIYHEKLWSDWLDNTKRVLFRSLKFSIHKSKTIKLASYKKNLQ